MGEKQKARMFWGMLGVAFAGGLALALFRPDVGHIVRPAIGVMMIAAGLVFMFGRVFEGPAAPDVERIFRRWQVGFGAGQMVFGASQLLPMGWGSTACMLLATIVLVGSHLATRREMAALASRPQG